MFSLDHMGSHGTDTDYLYCWSVAAVEDTKYLALKASQHQWDKGCQSEYG